ncbi:MAG: VWA domain-containing protein [Gemmatimonadales bacterium]
MSWDLPNVVLLAPAAGVLVALLAWWGRRRRTRAAAAWSPALAARARLGRWSPIILGVAAAVIGAGVAGPRWGSTELETETRALSVVFAIDISRSMLAEDVTPSRLGRAVRETRRLLQDARGDRLGLIAFAGRSYILTPLTLDDGAVELQLDALDPDVASEGGTELASVLRQGRELLEAVSEGGARVLVLLSDGEAHDSLQPAIDAARELRDAGITLVVVGEGGLEPTRIPIRDETGTLLEYKKDGAGVEVLTRRHDEVLRTVADAAQGILVPADFPDQAGAVWKTLGSLDRAGAKGRRNEDLVPRAWVFALGAFGIVLLQAAARRRGVLLALAVGLGASARAEAQRPASGLTALRARDSAAAIAAFSRAARFGWGADTSWFNGGTVALGTTEYDEARTLLGSAAESLDPAIRFRALYNLGLAALVQSRADSAKRAEFEDEAAQRFRDALLLDPASEAAKWNLELVSRRKPPPPPSSSSPQPQQSRGGGGTAPPRPNGMSAAEAEQILRSVERTEQAVRNEQLKRRRVAKSAAGKDW